MGICQDYSGKWQVTWCVDHQVTPNQLNDCVDAYWFQKLSMQSCKSLFSRLSPKQYRVFIDLSMLNSEMTTCSEHTVTCVPFFFTKVALGSFKCNGNHSTLWEKIVLQQNTNYNVKRTYLVISSCWVFQQQYVDKNCISCLFWQKTLLNVKHLPF